MRSSGNKEERLKAQDINWLLEKYPPLRVAYVDQVGGGQCYGGGGDSSSSSSSSSSKEERVMLLMLLLLLLVVVVKKYGPLSLLCVVDVMMMMMIGWLQDERGSYFSVLLGWDKGNHKPVEYYRVPLPGTILVGEGEEGEG